jgi:hypothetical protein
MKSSGLPWMSVNHRSPEAAVAPAIREAVHRGIEESRGRVLRIEPSGNREKPGASKELRETSEL